METTMTTDQGNNADKPTPQGRIQDPPSIFGAALGFLILCAIGALFVSLVAVAIIKLWGWAL
mgnify:CR=1 FL=1